MTDLADRAVTLARQLHAGQTDKLGRPYVEHLEAVVASGGREVPFHVGDAARAIGGLGEAVILAGSIGALAQRSGFAEAVYSALCNTVWRHRGGMKWACTWRCAGDIAAAIRGWNGDSYQTFYSSGGEGFVDERVRAEFAKLGWTLIGDAQAVSEGALEVRMTTTKDAT